MTDSKIDSMPLETLWMIARNVESFSKSQLFSFSLANKRLRSALFPLLFKEVKVTMRNEEDFEHHLTTVPDGITQHIRTMVIQGWVPRGQREDSSRAAEKDTPSYIDSHYTDKHIESDQNKYEARFPPPPGLFCWESQRSRNRYISPREEEFYDEDWEPLANFIANLPTLTDLLWNSWDQLPPCVLQALHKSHITCRLHLNTCHLTTLSNGPEPTLDPHEIDLLSSPCLYSATASNQMGSGPLQYPADTFCEAIAYGAPNLKEFHLVKPFVSHVKGSRGPRYSWKPWKGIKDGFKHRFDNSKEDKSQATLQRLSASFDIYSRPSFYSALSKIEFLKDNLLEFGPFEKWLEDGRRFDSLKTLWYTRSLEMNYWMGQRPWIERIELGRFLAALPSLNAFRCDRDLSSHAFDLILDTVGPQLEILWLYPNTSGPDAYFGYGEAVYQRISTACPILEYLAFETENEQERKRFLVKNGAFVDYIERE